MPPESQWMSAKELARSLGVDERTVRAWEASGVLPSAYRMSKRWVRWKRTEIEAWMAKRKKDGRAG